MKLYGSLTSPYVRKVRMVLMEKNLPCEMMVEGPADAAGNVVRLNPLRAIPVLERDDGEVFFDSPMICEYLDSLNDQPRLYPAGGEARWQALRWHALGQGIMEATVARFVELRKPAEKQDAPTVTKHAARIAAALAFAAERIPTSGFICGKTAPAFVQWMRFHSLTASRSALPPSMAVAGNTIGIADITLAAALGYIDLRYAHDWRGQHPKLASWFAAISQRPSFVETLAPELKK